jgi:hypothetical protein
VGFNNIKLILKWNENDKRDASPSKGRAAG